MPITNYIGLSKIQIVHQLDLVSEHYVEFAHWLYIPALSVLLSFEKQCCANMQWLG